MQLDAANAAGKLDGNYREFWLAGKTTHKPLTGPITDVNEVCKWQCNIRLKP